MSSSLLIEYRDTILQTADCEGILRMSLSDSLYRTAFMPSRWNFIQTLAGHSHPSSVLILGAPLGGEIKGALEEGHKTFILETNLFPQDILKGLYPEAHFRQATPLQNENIGYFDIVYITPFWIADAQNMGISYEGILLNAKNYLRNGGRLVMLFHNRKIKSARMVRILSGQRVDSNLLVDLAPWGVSSMKNFMDSENIDVNIFHTLGHFLVPTGVIAPDNGKNDITRFVFGEDRTVWANIRRFPFWFLLFLKLPIENALPISIITAKLREDDYSLQRTDPHHDYKWMKLTGRAVTTILEKDNKQWFVRIGGRSVKLETLLLDILSEEAVWKYIIPPTKKGKVSGSFTGWYPYLSGRPLPKYCKKRYQEKIKDFLVSLSSISPPAFLEPGYVRLHLYLTQRLEHHDEGHRELLIHEALAALERLTMKGAFSWITHGELRVANLRLVNCDLNLKVVDWVQCYRGHPLLDWWMFKYWDGAPNNCIGDSPNELRMGFSQDVVADLWTVWRAAYNR